MKRIAFLISGTGSNLRALLQSMGEDHPARPVLVLSNNPGAAGLKYAEDQGLATATLDHRAFASRAAFDEALLATLAPHAPDALCLAGFMRILGPDVIAAYPSRILNIHPSLLPKYPGLHTHDRALAAGDSEAGCSVHEVTEALDAGPLLGQARVPILPGDTAVTLAARVQGAEHLLYPAVLRRWAAGEALPLFLP